MFLAVVSANRISAAEIDLEPGTYVSRMDISKYTENGYDLIDDVVRFNQTSGDYLYVVDYASQSNLGGVKGQLNSTIAPLSVLGTVAVFAGTLLIGWVVDGVITYATGRSPSEWVAIMTGAAVDLGKGLWRGAVKLYMNITTKKPSYGMSSSGCVVQRNGISLCPMLI